MRKRTRKSGRKGEKVEENEKKWKKRTKSGRKGEKVEEKEKKEQKKDSLVWTIAKALLPTSRQLTTTG